MLGEDVLAKLANAKFVTLTGVAGSPTPTAADFDGSLARSLVVGGPGSSVPPDTTPALAAGMVDGQAALAVGEAFDSSGEVTERDVWIDEIAGDDALRTHLSTIDDVDRVEGRVAATLALAELATGAVGNYGLGRDPRGARERRDGPGARGPLGAPLRGREVAGGKTARVAVVVAWIVGFLAVRFLLISGREMVEAPALERVNYRGRIVFTAAGLLLVMAVLVVEAARSGLGAIGLGDEPGANAARPLVLFAAFGFGLLGLLDDVLGGEDRGFRGHLRALGHGRLTSGMFKLLGGAAIALVLAAAPGFVTWQRLFADAVLIALAANLANLLDRAPGQRDQVLAARLRTARGGGGRGSRRCGGGADDGRRTRRPAGRPPGAGDARRHRRQRARGRARSGGGARVLAHGAQRDLRRADRAEPVVGAGVVQSRDRAGAGAALVRPARS